MKSLYRECLALGVEADSEEAVYLFAESALYMLGSTGAFDFQKHIKHLCKNRSAKVFRLRLCDNHIALSLKLYLMHLSLTRPTKYMAKKLAEQYGLSNRDARLLWMLYSTNQWFAKAVNRFVRERGCRVGDLTVGKIEGLFERIYPSVLKYIKHVTYSKLRFLVKANNVDFQDLHGEIATKIVKEFYSLVPTKMSDAHVTNYLKRVVHNHAVNLIKSGTTQKRGRIVSTEADENGNRKFSMLCLSQNQMPLTELGEAADVDGEDDSSEKFELRFSLSEVLDSVKAYSRKHRFLSLLLGAEDKEFSDWLKTSGHCKPHEDNVDVQHRTTPDTYTKLLSNFLRVPSNSVESFFATLKRQMAW